jgi:hypothetical protein
MIIGLSSSCAHTLSQEFVQGEVKKEYIARCSGEFPAEEVVVDQPLLTVDRQMGLNIVHPQGKVGSSNYLASCLVTFLVTLSSPSLPRRCSNGYTMTEAQRRACFIVSETRSFSSDRRLESNHNRKITCTGRPLTGRCTSSHLTHHPDRIANGTHTRQLIRSASISNTSVTRLLMIPFTQKQKYGHVRSPHFAMIPISLYF